jgi:hypothetical protein
MAAIITDDFRRNQARLLVNDIKASADAAFDTPASNSNESTWPYRGTNRYSVGLGKTDSWADNAGPVTEDAVNFVVPVPAGNRQEDEDIINNLFTIKDVSGSAAKQLIAKNPWTTGRKYKVYDSADNDAFYSTGALYPCYVTYGNSVYLCLSNTAVVNGFTAVLPSATAPSVGNNYGYSSPNEGYVWCEVAKIPADDTHTTNQFVPIRREADITAITAAEIKRTGGLISHIGLISGGAGYEAISTTVTATIVKHDGTVATPAISFVPVIVGGVIQRIDIRDPATSPPEAGSYEFWGSNELGSTLTLTALSRIKSVNIKIEDSGDGIGAIASATVAPISGYGKNAIDVLPTWFVGVNASFVGTEADGDAPALKFRQVSLIKNFTATTGVDSSDAILDTLSSITLNSPVTPFPSLASGQVLYQAGSNAKFYFDHYDTGTGKLYYHQNSNGEVNKISPTVSATDEVGTTLNGSQVSAGVSAITDAEYIANVTGDHKINGEVIFQENRKPFTRDAAQTEEVKLIIQL